MSSRNFTGSGAASLFVTSPWGLAILTEQNSAFQSPVGAPGGTVFGGWRFDVKQNHFGPSGSFDGSGTDSVLVSSEWGLGVLKASGSSLTSVAMAANGTVLQGPEISGTNSVSFTIDTSVLRIGPVGNFDGDGKHSVIAVGSNAIGTLSVGNGSFIVRAAIPFGTAQAGGWQPTADDWFGAVGDYDGDGKDEVLVTGPWGIAIFRFCQAAQATLAYVGNNGTIGGWKLNTATDQFGPVGDFDGDGKPECLIRNTSGFALLKLSGGALTTVGQTAVGSDIDGWRCGSDDRLGPAADFNGDRRAELLVTSGWGMGVLTWSGSAWSVYGGAANGTACGDWRLDTQRDRMNVADDFDLDGRAELLVTSEWGMALLDLSGAPKSKFAAANGTTLGGWRLDTTNNNFECGTLSIAIIIYYDGMQLPTWRDTVPGLTSAFRGRGITVLTTQDTTQFMNAVRGFSGVCQPGDRLCIFLGLHGASTRIGPDTSTGPCGNHALQATTGDNGGIMTLGQISPSFRAIGFRGADLIVIDGSCDGGETVLDATGQAYCAVSVTGVNGPAGTDTTTYPAPQIDAMPVPSVFGAWWTLAANDVASLMNGAVLLGNASVERIHQRMFRNDGSACTSAAIFGRGALTNTTTLAGLGFWWWTATGCYLYPICFPYEASVFPNPPPWTGSADSLLTNAAGYYDPWQTLIAPYQTNVLAAAAADSTVAQLYAKNFNAIWQCAVNDPSWDAANDSAKHLADLGNINVAQFTGTAGFTRLVNFATFYFYLIPLLYQQQRSIIQALDAAVRASPTLKNKVPSAITKAPQIRMSDPRVDQGLKAQAQMIQAAGAKAQQLTVSLAPMPPILNTPTEAMVSGYLSDQLGRLTASSISQSTGDANVDKIIAQLLATYVDQNNALWQASFMFSAIEDALCAKQSGALVIPGDRTIF
jgi:hypothetical protein